MQEKIPPETLSRPWRWRPQQEFHKTIEVNIIGPCQRGNMTMSYERKLYPTQRNIQCQQKPFIRRLTGSRKVF